MNIALIVLFVLLVTADTILTYWILAKGGFQEAGKLMRFVIKRPVFAIAITISGTLFIVILIIDSGFYLWLIPLCIGMIFVLIHNWKTYKGG